MSMQGKWNGETLYKLKYPMQEEEQQQRYNKTQDIMKEGVEDTIAVMNNQDI